MSEPLTIQGVEAFALPESCQGCVHRCAQPAVGLGERYTDLFVGRYLLDDGKVGALFHQPGNYREELDERPYAPGRQVVQRGEDPMIGVISDVSNSPGQQLPGREVGGIADLDPYDLHGQVGCGLEVGCAQR